MLLETTSCIKCHRYGKLKKKVFAGNHNGENRYVDFKGAIIPNDMKI